MILIICIFSLLLMACEPAPKLTCREKIEANPALRAEFETELELFSRFKLLDQVALNKKSEYGDLVGVIVSLRQPTRYCFREPYIITGWALVEFPELKKHGRADEFIPLKLLKLINNELIPD